MNDGEQPEAAYERSMRKKITGPRAVRPGSTLNSKGGTCQLRLSRRSDAALEQIPDSKDLVSEQHKY